MDEGRRGIAGATAVSFVLVGAVALLTWGLTGTAYASPTAADAVPATDAREDTRSAAGAAGGDRSGAGTSGGDRSVGGPAGATAALVLSALVANWTGVAGVALAAANALASLVVPPLGPLGGGVRGLLSLVGGRGSPDGREPSVDPGDGEGDASRPVARDRRRSPGKASGYSRHDGSDPLVNDVRREINESIARSPGTYPARVADATGVPLSTVRYHLRVLLEEGVVQEATFGGKRRLYPAGSDHLALAAALEDDATASVLRTLARSGPATVSDLAERLDRAPSTLSYHLSRLADDDLVVRESEGVSVVTRLHPTVRAELDASRGETADERATVRT